jgi:glycosyltransferase involved in cell wall biosynthesis
MSIYQENGGPSKARNTGIKAAKGNYIAFLDADDLWLPYKLEKQVKYLELNPEISLVFGDMKIFNESSTVVDSAFKEYGYPSQNGNGRIPHAFEKLLERNFIFTGTDLMRKTCFQRTGYFDEKTRYGEDYHLWLRIALMHEISFIPDVLMMRRLHDKNLSREQEEFYRSKIILLEHLKQNYDVMIQQKNIDINGSILKSITKLSYFYYAKKKYPEALKALASYILYLFKIRLARVLK